jgi:hypothetical protein
MIRIPVVQITYQDEMMPSRVKYLEKELNILVRINEAEKSHYGVCRRRKSLVKN